MAQLMGVQSPRAGAAKSGPRWMVSPPKKTGKTGKTGATVAARANTRHGSRAPPPRQVIVTGFGTTAVLSASGDRDRAGLRRNLSTGHGDGAPTDEMVLGPAPVTNPLLGPSPAQQSPEEFEARAGAVRMVLLAGCNLRWLGSVLPLCTNLRVLDLHGNGLQDGCLDPLVGCANLIKLDASSNQLVDLPGPDFWAMLGQLRVLHLHDNALIMPNDGDPHRSPIHSIATSPRLAVLTLRGTPLAQLKTYRHYAVNLIWTLVVLDDYIVSDGEIIAGAEFTGIYAPCSPLYRFRSYVKCKPALHGIEREENAIYTMLFNAHRQQSKYSPVQTMQRAVKIILRLTRARRERLQAKRAATPSTPGAREDKFAVDSNKLLTTLFRVFDHHAAHPTDDYLEWVRQHPTTNTPAMMRARAFKGKTSVPLPGLELGQKPLCDLDRRVGTRAPGSNAALSSSLTISYRLPDPELNRVVVEAGAASAIAAAVSDATARTAAEYTVASSPPKAAVTRGGTADTVAAANTTPEPSPTPSQVTETVEVAVTSDNRRIAIAPCRFLKPLLKATAGRKALARQKQWAREKQGAAASVRDQKARSQLAVAEHHRGIRQQARKLQDEHAVLVGATVDSLQQQAADRKEGHRADVAAKLTARQRLEDSHAAALDKRTAVNAVERSDLLDRASAALAAKAERNKLGTSKRRENALRSRAEVFRAMEELRKERALTGALSKDRTSSMAAEIRRLDLEARRSKVAARRSQHQHRAESMSAAAREAGRPRDTPYFHGLESTPHGRGDAVGADVSQSLFNKPGPNDFIRPEHLTARAYPKQLWPGLPRFLTHRALVEEFEERWRDIGDFCSLKECRDRPLYACKTCYTKFRNFAATEISTAGQP